MKILVCVKWVIKPESKIEISSTQDGILSDDNCAWSLNEYDEHGVQEGLSIKEALLETSVDAISVGPSPFAAALQRAIGMGADRGIHILTNDGIFQNPFGVASKIASFAKEEKYDLIIAGVVSEDLMQGQVAPMTAQLLDIPCATSVVSQKISSDQKRILVQREMEGGFRDILEMPLPAVITVSSGINTPRYPSLSNVLRARKIGVDTIDGESVGQTETKEEIVNLFEPEKSRAGLVLDGTMDEKAAKLLGILKERSLIR